MRKWEKKIKDCEQRLEELNKEMKEKEQENRISKLRIKEMRRLLKHNQLKPLNHLGAGEELVSNQSQVQLAPLNKDNLQRHNQKMKRSPSSEKEEEANKDEKQDDVVEQQ